MLPTAQPVALPVEAQTRACGAAASRIATWLVSGAIQLDDGVHAGAVAGYINNDGRVDYVYPEITGYYLQWLAWLAERTHVTAVQVERATNAQRWLTRWLDFRDGPTRVYLSRTAEDWRNGAIFTFDIAMVLRGIGSATRARLIVPNCALVAALCERLIALIANDGELDACTRTHDGARLPDRWSTRRGPFLTKAAAGIIDASSVVKVPDVLRHAAERTYESAIAGLIAQPHDETHPYLYAVEGFLALPRHSMFETRLPKIGERFMQLLATIKKCGHVPERSTDDETRRLDIVAQTIRAGLLLQAHGALRQSKQVDLRHLADGLIEHVRTGGAIPFDPRAQSVQFNAWTAMFAEQALAMSSNEPRDVIPLAAARIV